MAFEVTESWVNFTLVYDCTFQLMIFLFKRPFTFEIEKFNTQSFSKVIEMNVTLSHSQITIYFNVLENLPNVFTNTVLNFESSDGIYDMEMVNRTIDYCKFFRDKRYEPILQIFHKIFLTGSNTPRRCPIKKVRRIERLRCNF